MSERFAWSKQTSYRSPAPLMKDRSSFRERVDSSQRGEDELRRVTVSQKGPPTPTQCLATSGAYVPRCLPRGRSLTSPQPRGVPTESSV